MDYTQVEEKFQSLKQQFSAGTLDEAAFKAQLNELMVQDAQGRWWMIGYETGQWYTHDGKAWVRADPPGRAPAQSVDLPSEPVEVQAEHEVTEQAQELQADQPDVQAPAQGEKPLTDKPVIAMPAPADEPPAAQPEAPARTLETPPAAAEVREPVPQAAAKPAGFIPNRGREVLLVLLGAAIFGLEGLFQSTHIFMVFGSILSLSGIFFGPWVGGLTGLLGELVAFAVFSARGFGEYDPMPFIVISTSYGVISGLLVKDARNWKTVLYACFLARTPLFLGDVVGQVDNMTQSYFADWFLNRLVDFLVPGLLLVPLVARALVDLVKERGWYWPDAPTPRKWMEMDWNTIILFGVVWSSAWGLIYGLGLKWDDLYGARFVYSGMCGIASGLAGGFVLRRAFPALRAGQILLITAGWTIGFLAAADGFANVVAFGNPYFQFVLIFLFMGFAGGISMGVALKWAGVYPNWRQALLSSIPWGVGLTVIAYLSNVLTDQHIYRLFIAGFLAGALGAWGIFWQSRQSSRSAETK